MVLVADTGNKRNMQILKHFHLLNITKYLGEHQYTSLCTDVPLPQKEGGRLHTGYNILVTCFLKNLLQEPIFSRPGHVLVPAPLLTVSTDLPSHLWLL